MTRPIPKGLLPHTDALKVEFSRGGSADGRKYSVGDTPPRCLIIDGSALRNGKYDPQSVATGTVYVPTESLTELPVPESQITVWLNTSAARVAHVESYTRYFDPRIGDLLEIRIK